MRAAPVSGLRRGFAYRCKGALFSSRCSATDCVVFDRDSDPRDDAIGRNVSPR
jgi:hypothetical protein